MLSDACLNGNMDLFKEIKNMTYANLYNSGDDKENIFELFENVNSFINNTYLHTCKMYRSS